MRGGQDVCELREAKSDQDAEDAGVVAEIEVEGLVGGEGECVVVEGGVDLGEGRADNVVLHAGEDFADVACLMGWLDVVCLGRERGRGRGKGKRRPTNADCTTDGRGKAGAGLEGDVEGVFVAFPFFVGEETAPV